MTVHYIFLGLGQTSTLRKKRCFREARKKIKVERTLEMTITTNDIKIKIKLLNSESLLAQATVILFDIWEEKGWKVLTSKNLHPVFQDFLWIQCPCFKTGVVWKEMVFINDSYLYNKVQEKIYDAYCRVRTEKKVLGAPDRTEEQNGTEKAEITDKDYEEIEKAIK